jgi:hypothetical protein
MFEVLGSNCAHRKSSPAMFEVLGSNCAHGKISPDTFKVLRSNCAHRKSSPAMFEVLGSNCGTVKFPLTRFKILGRTDCSKLSPMIQKMKYDCQLVQRIPRECTKMMSGNIISRGQIRVLVQI